MPDMSAHYWACVEHADLLREELCAAHADDTLQGRDKRLTLATELLALEAHLLRELLEAAGLGVGHRIP